MERRYLFPCGVWHPGEYNNHPTIWFCWSGCHVAGRHSASASAVRRL